MTLNVISVLRCFLEDPDRPRYGYELMRAAGVSGGTLYPILDRLKKEHWLRDGWEEIDPAEAGRPARRHYRLTSSGLVQGQRCRGRDSRPDQADRPPGAAAAALRGPGGVMGVTVLLGLLALAGAAAVNAMTGMLSQEVQTRLARLPVALLRVARVLVPGEQRDERYREWVAEVSYIAKETDGLPVTCLLEALKFAAGAITGAIAIRRSAWLGASRAEAEIAEQVRLLEEQIRIFGPEHIVMERVITQLTQMKVPEVISGDASSIPE